MYEIVKIQKRNLNKINKNKRTYKIYKLQRRKDVQKKRWHQSMMLRKNFSGDWK